ncbi:MAG TPA: diguanylate cyclase [Candidatus Obscuribacterales bacterium]
MTEGMQLETETSQLLAEIGRLRQENEKLQRRSHDLEIALSTTAEHGDFIEAELYETNIKLEAEIVERQRAQSMLQTLIAIVSAQRDDLKIILETLMEHGDVLDVQWGQKLGEVAQLAALDGLTQIANRRKFDEHLDLHWQQMAREQTPLAVILCDIDYFKEYNDTYGHLAGDDCLRKVAQALAQAVNRPYDLIARYGGEEFAAILPQTDQLGAIAIAHRLQAAIAQLQIPHAPTSASPYLTLSMGIAWTIPSPSRSPEHLIDEADQLLYLAKQRGRNQVVYC